MSTAHSKRSSGMGKRNQITLSLWLCKSIDEYQLLTEIGKGTYGAVYKGRNRKTGEIVALKKIKLYNEGQVGV